MRVVAKSFSVKYECLADENILLATVSGRYDLADPRTIEYIKITVSKLNEHNCSKCLVDHRLAEYIARTLFAYDRPKLLESQGFKRSVKIAGAFHRVTPEIHFLETVLRNRGWSVRAFTDYDEALTWLKGSES